MVSRPARVHLLPEVISGLSVIPSDTALVAAGEIWHEAVRSSSAPLAAGVVGDLVGAQLRANLARWIGLNGCRALLDRAVRVVVVRHPVLRQLPSLEAAHASGTTIHARVSVRTIAAGMTALLAMVIELLGHLIGVEIAMSLVKQSVGPSARGVASQGNPRGSNG